MIKVLKNLKVLLLIIIFISCGSDHEDLVEDAIISANNHLSYGRCQNAIDVLDEIGFNGNNARYIKALASGYACRAGYRTSNFIGTDISKTVNPAPLGGTSTYTTSDDMTALDSDDYQDIKQAVNLLLYAGNIPTNENPSPEKRAARFNAIEANDINTFALYLLLAQLGKYFYYYGDASATGVKGGGAASNVCFGNYTNTNLDNTSTAVYSNTNEVLDALGGACTSGANLGHPELGSAGSLNKERLCQGIVVLNNMFEILPEVLSGAFDDLDDLDGLEAVINAQKALLASEHRPLEITSTLSQTLCEAQTEEDLTMYFVFIVEPLIQ